MKAWVGMNLQGHRHGYVGSEEPLPFLEIGLALMVHQVGRPVRGMVHDTPRYGIHVAVQRLPSAPEVRASAPATTDRLTQPAQALYLAAPAVVPPNVVWMTPKAL